MKKHKYKARINSSLSDDDAEVIGLFIENNGDGLTITAEELVVLSKDKQAATHKYFDWNDKTAAEKYRLQRAREMISSIEITVQGEDTKAFHSVYIEELDERRYVFFDQARNTESLWQQVIDSALKEATGWANRYEKYKELAPIVGAIKKVKDTYNEKERSQTTRRRSSRNPKN